MQLSKALAYVLNLKPLRLGRLGAQHIRNDLNKRIMSQNGLALRFCASHNLVARTKHQGGGFGPLALVSHRGELAANHPLALSLCGVHMSMLAVQPLQLRTPRRACRDNVFYLQEPPVLNALFYCVVF